MNKDSQNEKDFLKEVAPTLFGNKLKVDEAAPTGYFESLPEILRQRVRNEAEVKSSKPKGILRHINFYNVAIAAGVAVVLALVPAIRHWQGDNQITPAEVETLTYSEADVDEAYAEMLEGYPEADQWILETEMVDLIAVTTISAGVSTEELEDYLIEEGLSEALILEAYYEQN